MDGWNFEYQTKLRTLVVNKDKKNFCSNFQTTIALSMQWLKKCHLLFLILNHQIKNKNWTDNKKDKEGKRDVLQALIDPNIGKSSFIYFEVTIVS